MGRIDRKEGPFFGTAFAYPQAPPAEYFYEETVYDYRGRPESVTTPDGTWGTPATIYYYYGFSTDITDPDGCQKTEKRDHLGRIIQVTEYNDTEQYHTYYSYDGVGNMRTVTNHYGNVTSLTYDWLSHKLTMDDPDMGAWSYTYDPNGNLHTQTDANGTTVSFEYDALNRLLSKTYSITDPNVATTPAVDYYYDNTAAGANGIGRLHEIVNGDVSRTVNSYDEMGREESVSKLISGDPTVYTTLYSYDFSGKLVDKTFPDGFVMSYSFYLGSGLIHTVTGSDGVEYGRFTDYEPTGKIGHVAHTGNGTSTTYSYDRKSTRLTDIVTRNPQQVILQSKSYDYSAAGDILQIVNAQTGITYTYDYDGLHRLISETNNGPTGAPESAILISTYEDLDHVHAVSNINFNAVSHDIVYDGNGNMTDGFDFTNSGQIASRIITYNADNMPVSVVLSPGRNNDLSL